MRILKNKSLKNLNTLKVNVNAKYFVEVESDDELKEAILFVKSKRLKIFILGSGSNILFTKDFDGLVIKNSIKGKRITHQTDKYIHLQAGGGEDWHNLVNWTVGKGYGGVENLALIPGTVGAAPVQNIAAYGQNFSDVFVSLEAVNISNGESERFYNKECEFGYRSSIFKKHSKNKYAVKLVTIQLNKQPKLATSYYMTGISYASIKGELEKNAKKPYEVKDVYNAVVNIRREKLPDWKKTPTVGSFFLNPVISIKKLKELQKKIGALQYYPLDQLYYPKLKEIDLNKQGYVKVPAGRLLDELGWRGRKVGNCWMYDRHALVLVHNGKANGKEILKFSKIVQKDCYKHFGIHLETEVSII
ncbi:MAG: UDP-N-acetylmuramate dehydrogenase [Candidatus Hodarchaeales archaeon]|jgi:UDP-N-acetylmuramate dehydrogenase